MVVIPLLFLAAALSLLFAVLYTLFFPWWRSRLGRSLAVTHFSLSMVLVLAILHRLGLGVYPVLLGISVLGLISANLGMVMELVSVWKANGSRRVD